MLVGKKREYRALWPRSVGTDQGEWRATISEGSTPFAGKVARTQTTGQPGHCTQPRSAAFGREDAVVPLIHAFLAIEQSIKYRRKLNNHIMWLWYVRSCWFDQYETFKITPGDFCSYLPDQVLLASPPLRCGEGCWRTPKLSGFRWPDKTDLGSQSKGWFSVTEPKTPVTVRPLIIAAIIWQK